jgi:predicted nucleotidyltransferase
MANDGSSDTLTQGVAGVAAIGVRLPEHLPKSVRLGLLDFCTAAREAFGEDMCSLVLFGSAAEGRMRATSDVNLLVVLRTFDAMRADAIRDSIRIASAAIHLRAMFVIEDELELAAESFAVKFEDILQRRHVLYGGDPFAALRIPPPMIKQRLTQVLLNLALRLRATYIRFSAREQRLLCEIAEAAAPLRASAHAILVLEGRAAPSGKEALQQLTAELPGGDWREDLELVSVAREKGVLPLGAARPLLLRLIDLATAMRRRAESLQP